jgi:hypothetical protein
MPSNPPRIPRSVGTRIVGKPLAVPPRLGTKRAPSAAGASSSAVVPTAPTVARVRPTPPAVVVKEDARTNVLTPVSRQRTESLIAEVHAIRRDIAKQLYRLGVVLRELQRPEVLATVRCATYDELHARYGLVAKMTAEKYLALVAHFSEPQAIELGVEKGYQVVRYSAQVLASRKAPAALLRENPRIAGIALREHTGSTLSAAIRAWSDARRKRTEESDDTVQEADGAVRKLGGRLRKLVAPGASLRRVKKRGAWRVVIELDPDEALELASRL